MKYSTKNLAEALYSLHKEDSKTCAKIFADFLVKNNLVKQLPKILRELEYVTLKKDGIRKITVEGADEESVESTAKQFDSKNLIVSKVNPLLIKGLRITIGEDRYDNSLKRRLEDWEK